MSASHTSASDPGTQDTLNLLWRLSGVAREGTDIRGDLEPLKLDGLSQLETEVCLAVRSHLAAIADLTEGILNKEAQADPLSRWDAVLAEVQHMAASLTPRSHAFHMRLASKYADYYRSFEERALTQWVGASRLKSEFLRAVAAYRNGNLKKASETVEGISSEWRQNLPIRLPGLLEIERTGHVWAIRAGNTFLADKLAANAALLTGRLSPYEEDDASVWAAPRTIEQIVRFGFAATVLPPRGLLI